MTVQPIGIVPEWTFADRLRKARRQTSMTQKAFAAAIGADEKAYSQWEAGNNRPRELVDICQAVERVTGVSAGWLLGLVPGSGDGLAHEHRGYMRGDDFACFQPIHGGRWLAAVPAA